MYTFNVSLWPDSWIESTIWTNNLIMLIEILVQEVNASKLNSSLNNVGKKFITVFKSIACDACKSFN